MQSNMYELVAANPYRASAILYWAIASLVKKPATALMCCNHGSCAALFAQQAGFDTIQMPSKQGLIQHGFWLNKQQELAGYEPLILSKRNLNAVLRPRVEAGFNQLAHPEQTIKQRRFDEHFSALKEVSWIHSSYADATSMLQGALQGIQKHKPIISLSALAAQLPVSEYLSLLEPIGYRLFDSALNELSATENADGVARSMLIALPADTHVVDKLVSACGFEQRIKLPLSPTQQTKQVKRYYHSLIAHPGKPSLMLEKYLFSDNQVLDIASLLKKDMYPQDSDGCDTWSWTGPGKEASLIIPIPAVGDYFFRLICGDLPANTSSHFLAVFAAGKNVFLGDVQSADVIEFSVNVSEQSFDEELCVQVCVGQMTDVDGKLLGLSIKKIEMYCSEDEL